jgi:hypothetical protein
MTLLGVNTNLWGKAAWLAGKSVGGWTPAQMEAANLPFWINIDDSVLNTLSGGGGSVPSSHDDPIGRAVSISPATGIATCPDDDDRRPLLGIGTGYTLNGHNCFNLEDSGTKYFNVDDAGEWDGEIWWFTIVLSHTTSIGNFQSKTILRKGTGDTSRFGLDYSSTSGYRWRVHVGPAIATSSWYATHTLLYPDPSIITFKIDGTSTPNTDTWIYVNGTLKESLSPTTTGIDSASTMRLLRYDNDDTDSNIHGQFWECLVYNTDEQSNVESYLSDKFDIALSS